VVPWGTPSLLPEILAFASAQNLRCGNLALHYRSHGHASDLNKQTFFSLAFRQESGGTPLIHLASPAASEDDAETPGNISPQAKATAKAAMKKTPGKKVKSAKVKARKPKKKAAKGTKPKTGNVKPKMKKPTKGMKRPAAAKAVNDELDSEEDLEEDGDDDEDSEEVIAEAAEDCESEVEAENEDGEEKEADKAPGKKIAWRDFLAPAKKPAAAPCETSPVKKQNSKAANKPPAAL